jgi:PAS domain S-box-containing protein
MNEHGDDNTTQSILVVDDSADNLRLLTGILQNYGYVIRPVRDGQTALKSVRSQPPDLILLDIMMPTPDGYEVCRQLKADEQTRDIPIIFISALDEIEDKIKGFEAGGVDYITKPFQPQEVLARVRTHLTLQKTQKELQEKNLRLQQEMSERKQIEKAVIKAKREWEKTFDTVPDLIAILDQEHRILRVNKSLADRVQLEPKMCIGKQCYLCLHGKDDSPPTFCPHIRLLESKQEHQEEIYEERLGGYFFITVSPIFDDEDQLYGSVHVARDITERKQAEEALQYHNQELSLLNRIGQMMSSSLELRQVLKTALEEIQRFLNVISASFWLMEEDDLVCMHAIGPGSQQLIQQRLAQGQGITGWVIQHQKSAVVADIKTDPRHFQYIDEHTGMTVHSMLSVPLLMKGTVIGVLNLADPKIGRFTQKELGFIELIAATATIAIENARLYTMAQQEIAVRKQAEDALKEAITQLKHANDSKDKFFSIISHDLRSPFTVLIGATELLEEYFETFSQDELKAEIAILKETAKKLYALLENLLTWSRIQRGVMEFEPQVCNLWEMTESSRDLFSSKAQQKEITLINSILENSSVYADYNMVNTVIRNLISNALKFTEPKGTIEISVRQREQYIEVAVSDTGVGIPQEDISKLFRIDVQYSHTGTAEEKGTGLGLILCQELVKRNGGTIWAESEPGKGSTFRFTLPRPS